MAQQAAPDALALRVRRDVGVAHQRHLVHAGLVALGFGLARALGLLLHRQFEALQILEGGGELDLRVGAFTLQLAQGRLQIFAAAFDRAQEGRKGQAADIGLVGALAFARDIVFEVGELWSCSPGAGVSARWGCGILAGLLNAQAILIYPIIAPWDLTGAYPGFAKVGVPVLWPFAQTSDGGGILVQPMVSQDSGLEAMISMVSRGGV